MYVCVFFLLFLKKCKKDILVKSGDSIWLHLQLVPGGGTALKLAAILERPFLRWLVEFPSFLLELLESVFLESVFVSCTDFCSDLEFSAAVSTVL